MARASFLIPVYFFSSIRAGSGKASLVANLAVFLNNLRQKIALIDLDSEAPLKLKNSFPQSIALQEYQDVSLTVKSEENRFQKNFYFTETSQISYFPAQKLPDPSIIFTDTALRDFFIQLKASFDCVIINYPPGPSHCQKISELFSRQHLWRGSRPASLIVSQADEKCLISLDCLLQQNPALAYQLQENTCLIFNRIPTAPEDQNLAENTLSGSELRKIFDQQQTYLIPLNEEFQRQRLEAWPTVLKTDSLMHQTVSGLHRLLSHSGEGLLKPPGGRHNDYQACLDGDLLEKLTPYLERIHQAAASRLFVHPSELQVFLEEGPGNFRIKIRISGITQPLLGINTRLPQEPECKARQRPSPEGFLHQDMSAEAEPASPVERVTFSGLNMRPVYKFKECFTWEPEKTLHPGIPFVPHKEACPSPILFKQNNEIPEVPSLSHVLGYSARKYKKFNFGTPHKFCEISGVTHFFIPPEFSLSFNLYSHFSATYPLSSKAAERNKIDHWTIFDLAYLWPPVKNDSAPELPDEFARNKPFIPELDFYLRCLPDSESDFASTCQNIRFFSQENQIFPVPCRFNLLANASIALSSSISPASMALPLDGARKAIMETTNQDQMKARAREVPASFTNVFKGPAEVYKEQKQSASLIKMLKSLFFPAQKLFADLKPEAPVIATGFTTFHEPSPCLMNLGNAAPAAKESFALPSETKVPSSFACEDLLMDHVYPDKPSINLGKNYLFNFIRRFSDLKPGMQIFFKQTFPDARFDKIIEGITLNKSILDQSFRSFSADLKTLKFAPTASVSRLAFDLFHVRFIFKNDGSARDAADASFYKSDHIVDSALKTRSFAPHKGRILQILAPHGNDLLASLKPDNKYLKPFTGEIPLNPMILLNLTCKSSQIKKFCNLDQLPTNLFADYRPGLAIYKGRNFSAHQITRTFFTTVFASDDIQLTTLSLRQEQRKFYSFPGDEIDVKISIKPVIARRLFNLPSIPEKRFECSINHDPLHIPPSLPLRFRKIESPILNRQLPSCLILRLERNMKALIWQSATVNADIKAKVCKVHHNSHINPAMPVKYPLAVAAHKGFRRIPMKNISFFVRTPATLEILFEHLIHMLKKMQTSSLPMNEPNIDNMNQYMSESFVHKANLLSYQEIFGKKPVRHEKMSQRAVRETYQISNLRLRDLMSLARQANQKFNEISQKIIA